MTHKPAVTIIMSCFKAAKKVDKTIESVLQQSFSDFQFVIVDDASNDNLEAKIKPYIEHDPRILFIKNTKNLGLTHNLFEAVKASQANYIARIDAGDLWLPNKLKQQIDYLEKNPETVLCGTQASYTNREGKIVNQSWLAERDADIRRNLIIRRGLFEHSSIVFRNIINYRKIFTYSQDLDLYARISFLGELHCLSDALTLCEINDDGITLKNKFSQRQFQNHAYALYLKALKHPEQAYPNPEKLTLRKNRIEQYFCKLALRHYADYVKARTENPEKKAWVLPLLKSLLLYPPLAGDYLKKLALPFFLSSFIQKGHEKEKSHNSDHKPDKQ